MKTAEEVAKEIELEAFDDWAFDKESKQYKGAFDLDECAALIRAYGESVLNTIIENLAIQDFVSFSKGKEPIRGIKADDIGRVLAAVKKEVRDENG